MELAIDTSSEMTAIALAEAGSLRREVTWLSHQNHTVELMPAVVRLLEESGVAFEQVGAVVVARGPGSFNGLRVGMAAAKGLAWARQLPIVGVSTLEVEAYAFGFTGLPVCAVHDAGRGELAAAMFRMSGSDWSRVADEHLTNIDALVAGTVEPTIFCGELPGAAAAALLERLAGRALIPAGAGRVRRAGYLAELGWRRLARGDSDNAAALQPLYLRHPQIGAAKKID